MSENTISFIQQVDAEDPSTPLVQKIPDGLKRHDREKASMYCLADLQWMREKEQGFFESLEYYRTTSVHFAALCDLLCSQELLLELWKSLLEVRGCGPWLSGGTTAQFQQEEVLVNRSREERFVLKHLFESLQAESLDIERERRCHRIETRFLAGNIDRDLVG